MSTPHVVTTGLHIADILGRPVTEIPPGQGLALLDEIRMTIAGTCAATAMDLARLGIQVTTFGVVGDDSIGLWLTRALTEEGVNTEGVRVDSSTPTSATMLPIRPNGERPALHVIGANAKIVPSDVKWEDAPTASHFHLGGSLLLEGIDGEGTVRLLREAKERGMTTSMDIIGVPGKDYDALFGKAYSYLDYLLVNDDDVVLLTGATSVESGIDSMLAEGVGACVITIGADGALYKDKDGLGFHKPSHSIDVVDTTGCGDAFSAGFIAGVVLGKSMEESVELGIASGSAVARALGSDAGVHSFEELMEFRASTPLRN